MGSRCTAWTTHNTPTRPDAQVIKNAPQPSLRRDRLKQPLTVIPQVIMMAVTDGREKESKSF